ncbi:MAG: prepilin-type N-terminal cleavage/methylation domain-containing protein, partial [Acidobacteriota bacterium]
MRRSNQAGVTLIELLVVVVVGAIVLSAAVGTYLQVLRIHQRQQRVILVEQELSSIQQNMEEVLTTQTGRELGFY